MKFFTATILQWKKLPLSLLGIAIAYVANAQFDIETLEVLPAHPLNTEDTRLIIRMYYDVSGCDYNSSNLKIETDSCRVNEYFDCGAGFSMPSIKRDTVNLGILPVDSFYVKVVMNSITHWYYPAADTIHMDSAEITFYVTQNNAIVYPANQPSFFSCYPNPSNGNFTIKNENLHQSFELKVYDIIGQLQKAIEVPMNAHMINMNLSNLPNGIYWISFVTGETQLVAEKIVIIK